MSSQILIDCGNTQCKIAINQDPLELQRIDDAQLPMWAEQTDLAGVQISLLVGNSVRAAFCQELCSEQGAQVTLIQQSDLASKQCDHYEGMGADRFCAGIAAIQHFQSDVIVVDAGTMLTVSAWRYKPENDFQASFVGGFIAPGAQASLLAMHWAAPALPALEFEGVEQLLGSDTESHMKNAIAVAWPAQAQALICEAQKHLPNAQLIACGGHLASIKELEVLSKASIDHALVLKGLRLFV